MITFQMASHVLKKSGEKKTSNQYSNWIHLKAIRVFETYQSACKGVQDWTQALDVGPFEQFKSETEPI